MNDFFEEKRERNACLSPFFNFYLIKLKKCPFLEGSNPYLRTEADLDLLNMHPVMFKEGPHANLIREHSRTLYEKRKKRKNRGFLPIFQAKLSKKGPISPH